MSAKRTLISSGTVWEKKYGYSRAVLVGDSSPYEQARFIYQKIDRAGSSLRDIVRVRTFVVDITRWEEVARAQGEVFAAIRPAATLVQVSALVDPKLLVEIEVDAVKAST